jgi:hypothetical protein
LSSHTWKEKSAAEVGWEWGFYDRPGGGENLEHPDQTFAKFEREYPLVRQKLIEKRFRHWVKQRHFLLGFMQMLRARSPLFIQQQAAESSALRGAKITAVEGNKITLESFDPLPLPARVVRNIVIARMQQEIGKGPDWLWDFNWCLRYTDDPTLSFVTTEQPFAVTGPAPDLVTAITHPDTLVFFPICWQACLVGSIRRFDVGTEAAQPEFIEFVRSLFVQHATEFVIAALPFQSRIASRFQADSGFIPFGRLP